MLLTSLSDAVEEGLKDTITDFTINGKCSDCGQCCNALLPLSNKELKVIRNYVRSHDIKPYRNFAPTVNRVLDMTCPFRNRTEGNCMIYPVRPEVCKSFICNDADFRSKREKVASTRKFVNLRKVFK